MEDGKRMLGLVQEHALTRFGRIIINEKKTGWVWFLGDRDENWEMKTMSRYDSTQKRQI